MVAAESLPIEERVLQTTKNRGALRGFSNLLGKEYGSWWTTRRWFVHLLLWPLLLNGLVLVLSFSLSKEPHFTAFEIAQMVTTLFFIGMGQVAAFGAVVATQSAITGEKQRGTAAWIMSKPVRRGCLRAGQARGSDDELPEPRCRNPERDILRAEPDSVG
jgi:ABC-2 type transport system permease protein